MSRLYHISSIRHCSYMYYLFHCSDCAAAIWKASDINELASYIPYVQATLSATEQAMFCIPIKPFPDLWVCIIVRFRYRLVFIVWMYSYVKFACIYLNKLLCQQTYLDAGGPLLLHFFLTLGRNFSKRGGGSLICTKMLEPGKVTCMRLMKRWARASLVEHLW